MPTFADSLAALVAKLDAVPAPAPTAESPVRAVLVDTHKALTAVAEDPGAAVGGTSVLRSLAALVAKAATEIDVAALRKAELDPYTAATVTSSAISSKVWCLQDALRDGDLAKATGEMTAISAMLANLTTLLSANGAAPASAEGASAATAPAPEAAKAEKGLLSGEMTQAEFAAWTASQLSLAKAEAADLAAARLDHLRKVTAAVLATVKNFEGTTPTHLPMQLEGHYAPDGFGTRANETAESDQSSKTQPPAVVSSVSTSFSANSASPTYGTASAPSVAGFPPPSPAPSSGYSAAGGAPPVAKRAAASDDAWPLDMAKGLPLVPFASLPVGVSVSLDHPAFAAPLSLVSALAVGSAALVPAELTKASGFERGASLDDMRELFLGADAGCAGVLVCRRKEDGTWTASMAKSLVPYVLTKDAVDAGHMPPVGESWLPSSLAEALPAPFRYWESGDAESALAMRKALVDSGLVSADLVKLVDGSIRLLEARHFLFDPAGYQPAAAPAPAAALGKVLASMPDCDVDMSTSVALAKSGGPLVLNVVTADLSSTLAKAVAAAKPDGPWLAVLPDTDAVRKDWASVSPLFAVPGGLLAGSVPSAVLPGLVLPAVEAPAPASFDVAIVKAEEPAADERYVLGVVLEPETVDKQKDVYSAAEVRQAAHKYMQQFGSLKLMHEGEDINGKVAVLESYVAPVEFSIGDRVVKQGTWLMATRIIDDGLWALVKSGKLTGYSIGGTALRKPEADAPAAE